MSSSDLLPPALCLMGPTACGKTAVAVELAEHYPFEIISVDSALVYRGLDIGSGKPDAETQARAPHRLIDIRDPSEAYSASDFRADALQEISNIIERGNIPLLVGGTMLYFKVLRDGLASMPAATPEIRQKILTLAENEGWSAVHARLQQVDPKAAARIHPNDPQRLQRAMEVYEVSGRPMSELHAEEPQGPGDDLPCQLKFMAMIPEQRSQLHEQIARRFHKMLEDGLVQEVQALRDRGDLDASLPAIRSVGYRQAWEYLAGDFDYDTMTEKAIAATRQLAKRQHTWLRGWPDLTEVTATLTTDDVKKVKNHLNSLLGITI